MKERMLVVFESASKCGKTTLSEKVKNLLEQKYPDIPLLLERSALSRSKFSEELLRYRLEDLPYSTAFYWADLLFLVADKLKPFLSNSGRGVAILDRYDLSILSYREAHQLIGNDLLLDNLLSRELVLQPDLTVFLDPPYETVLKRIIEDEKWSLADAKFLDAYRFAVMQGRIRVHLRRLGRRCLTLDTAAKSEAQCTDAILAAIEDLWRSS